MKNLALLLLLAVIAAVPAFAEEERTGQARIREKRLESTASPGPGTEHEHMTMDSFRDWFHNPAEGWEMGFDIRFREVYGWGIDTLNDDATARSSKWHFERYRFRWSTKWNVTEDIDWNMRMVWEFRTWDDPPRKNQSFDGDEALFDRFNLTVNNLMDMPLKMVVGRQDIILGKGWLVLDGTPLDGSRTIYLDGLRLTYDWEEADTVLDAIYIEQRAATDAWLHPINGRHRHVTEQDERGVILYATNDGGLIEDTQLEGYFMYKNDNPVDPAVNDFPSAWPKYLWSRKAEIFTFGGAAQADLDENWHYRAEGALQLGERTERGTTAVGPEQDLEAFGAKGFLGYKFNDEMKNEVHLCYEYLSGDDPDTADDEAFDPLWGEWPQWSELYIYTVSREQAIGEMTNLHRLHMGHSFYPWEDLSVSTDYHLLWTDQNTYPGRTLGDGFTTTKTGDFRGQLVTCWLKYNFSKTLKGHIVTEYFVPGDYYGESSRDDAVFFRFNIEYTF